MSSIMYIKRASQLITVRGGTKEPKRAQDMSDIGIIEHGSVVVENGMITFVGS
ncbi:imidazolonepropionase, partial [Priestia megaterium]